MIRIGQEPGGKAQHRDELYDLAKDPDERVNLARDGASAKRRDELTRRLQDFFSRHADPKYDLWKGGVSKVRRPL